MKDGEDAVNSEKTFPILALDSTDRKTNRPSFEPSCMF